MHALKVLVLDSRSKSSKICQALELLQSRCHSFAQPIKQLGDSGNSISQQKIEIFLSKLFKKFVNYCLVVKILLNTSASRISWALSLVWLPDTCSVQKFVIESTIKQLVINRRFLVQVSHAYCLSCIR